MNTGRVWKIGNFQPICLWNDTAYSIDYDQLLIARHVHCIETSDGKALLPHSALWQLFSRLLYLTDSWLASTMVLYFWHYLLFKASLVRHI